MAMEGVVLVLRIYRFAVKKEVGLQFDRVQRFQYKSLARKVKESRRR